VVSSYWERGEFPFELVPKIAAFNLVADHNMRDHGCRPMSAVGAGLVMMELSRIESSVATFFALHLGLAMQSINLLGSEEQRRRYLPPMARFEKIGAVGLSEPDHGSDSVALEATARREGSEWVSMAASVSRVTPCGATISSFTRAMLPTSKSRHSSSRRTIPAARRPRSRARFRCVWSKMLTSRSPIVEFPKKRVCKTAIRSRTAREF
jgi:Acyl-CoA dehydrogenase, N-terminal domain